MTFACLPTYTHTHMDTLIYDAIGSLALKGIVLVEGSLLNINLCIPLNFVHRQIHIYDAIGSLVFMIL